MRHEFKEHFDQALGADKFRRGIFDPDAVERLVKRDRSGHVDAAYPLFGLVCSGTWCCRFIDNGTEIDLAI